MTRADDLDEYVADKCNCIAKQRILYLPRLLSGGWVVNAGKQKNDW